MDSDFSHERAVASEVAQAAGDLVRDSLFTHLAVHDKGVDGDVVTDLDFAAEKLIINMIRSRFPQHRVISEEAGALGTGRLWTWLVDPVDGTNNIAVGLPVLAIGLTLCRGDVPVVSAVHDPVSRRTWSAVLGRGAWDDSGHGLHKSSVTRGTARGTHADRGGVSSRKPVLAWIQGYDVQRDDPTARALKLVLSQGAHRLLDLWAPLTCWMMLARGDIDGIVGYRIGELDLLAGALIAGEAGFTVNDFSGKPFDARLSGMDDRRVLAGTPDLVKRLIATVSVAAQLAHDLDDVMAASAALACPDETADGQPS